MEWSVLGHEKQRSYLERLLTSGSLRHAYLLAGPEGIGKRLIAEDLIRESIPTGYTFDVLRLAPERDEEGKIRDIPIDSIRELKSWIALRPLGAKKIVIIDNADRLGIEAANTLLKVLEEPPAYGHFFLITSRPGAMMPTIMSRLERMDFYPLSDSEMRSALHGPKLSESQWELLRIISPGRPAAAMRLLHDKRLPEAQEAIAGLQKAVQAGLTERLLYAKEVAESDTIVETVDWWLAWVKSQVGHTPSLVAIGHHLLDLRSAVSEPSFNRRLAMENFFLSV
jgi:DNA polymerase-3 subunit delta'